MTYRCLVPTLIVLTAVAVVLPRPAVADQGGPDGFGYMWYDDIEYSFEAGSVGLSLSGDGYSTVSIGFDFEFYGQTFSEVTVCADGVLHFEGSSAVDYENTALPYSTWRMIAAMWDNLAPDGGGDVYYAMTGAAPNRVFLVEWRDVPHYALAYPYYTTGDSTFVVKLHEEDGAIEVHYQDVNFGDATVDYGASATIGIQDNLQGYYLERSYNTVVLSDEYALRFEPCPDADADGHQADHCGGDDCNDEEALAYPGNAELSCDWVDNDCDGVLHSDEVDDDFDGWDECLGDCDDTDPALNADDADGDGFDTCADDCDDNEPAAYPGATEICDGGIDNDCDGMADDVDLDGDGYLATGCGDDCDDSDPDVNVSEMEICNFVDDNCDGQIDEGYDLDADGYSTCDGDCDDSTAAVSPAATETCNFIDDNCDGDIDEGFDYDGDGWTVCAGDCHEGSPAINPGMPEICNGGLDDDCDAYTDENVDVDGDGYSVCDGDCDDHDPNT